MNRPAGGDPTGCPHCGAQVVGPPGTYCCAGCEMAASIIAGAGLDTYYASREEAAPRPQPVGLSTWAGYPTVATSDGEEVCFGVDGLRCSSCVWVTEKVLERTPGVKSAMVSYASGRARVVFEPGALAVPDVVSRVAQLGYRPRPEGGRSTADRSILVRLGLAAFAAMNVMAYSVSLYLGWQSAMDPRFAQLFRWMSLLVSTPVVMYSAAPFFEGAWGGLKRGLLAMDLPIALAVGGLYVHGIWATVNHVDGYLDSLTMLVFLLLVGRALEARGRKRAQDAAESLGASLPDRVRREGEDGVEVIEADQVQVGDRLRYGLGDVLATDGVVLDGEAELQMALLTGESEPVHRGPRDRVVAGAVVMGGQLTVGVTREAQASLVAQMTRSLAASTDRPAPRSWADGLAPWFTAATLACAALAAGWMLWQGHPGEALERAVAVLVVACPCALALSQPVVGAAGLGASARRGLLMRDVGRLLLLGQAKHLVVDKTGTLTGGRPEVVEASDEALSWAAAVESDSHHPIALAIVEEAVSRQIPLRRGERLEEKVGEGVVGWVDGQQVAVGRGGPGRVRVTVDGTSLGDICVQDRPRPGMQGQLDHLVQTGLDVVMLSGDHPHVVERVAADLHIADARGGLTPHDKVDALQQLQRDGGAIFVGDGVNDTPAMGAAQVGIAMGAGAPSAVLAADGVLVGDEVGALASARRAAHLTAQRIRRNSLRSVAYNVVSVSLAMAGYINPLVAAVLMPLSSGLVLLSAATLEGQLQRSET